MIPFITLFSFHFNRRHTQINSSAFSETIGCHALSQKDSRPTGTERANLEQAFLPKLFSPLTISSFNKPKAY